MTIKQQKKYTPVSAWKPTINQENPILLKGGDLIQLKSSIGKIYKVCSAFDSAIAEGLNPIAVFQDLSNKGKPCFWLETHAELAGRSHVTIEDNSTIKFHGQYFTVSLSAGSPQLRPIVQPQNQLNSLDEIKFALSKARERAAEQAKQHYPIVRSRGTKITAFDSHGIASSSFEVTKFTSKYQLEKAIKCSKSDTQVETICLSGGYDGLNSISDPTTTTLVSQFSLPVWSKSLGYLSINND